MTKTNQIAITKSLNPIILDKCGKKQAVKWHLKLFYT